MHMVRLGVLLLVALCIPLLLVAQERMIEPTPGYNSDNSLITTPPLTVSELLAQRGDLAPIDPGTYSIGTGGDYTTLSDAVAALQGGGLSGGGTVIFQFTNASYTDTAQIIGGYFNQSSANPVIFRNAPGVTARILFSGGSTVNSGAAIRLDSAVGISWMRNTTGSLTIECDTNTTSSRTPILIRKGSSYLTFKQLTVKGNRHTTGSFGSNVVLDNTLGATAGPQHHITVDSCHLLRGNHGIYQLGLDGNTLDYTLTFTNNLIGGGAGAALYDNLAGNGVILVQASNNVLIDRNDINGLKAVGSPVGISIRGANSNITVTRNKIHNVVTLSGANRPFGFLIGNALTAGTPVKVTAFIANNMVYDVHSFGSGASRGFNNIYYNPTGPAASPNGAGTAVQYINNTFHYDLAAGEAGPGTCYLFDANYAGASTTPGVIDSIVLKNNILSCKRPDGFTRTFLIFPPGASGNLAFVSNNNLFYQIDAGAFGQYPTPWPEGATTVNALYSDWQTITGNDLNSPQANPLFVSATDAHINMNPGYMSPADSLGLPYAGVTVDIDNEARDPNRPDAGADEFFTTPANKDIQVLSVTMSPVTPHVGTPVTVSAQLKNNGNEVSPFNIAVTYKAGSMPTDSTDGVKQNFSPTWSANLATVSFTTTYSPVATGLLNMYVRSFYVDDAIPSNDSTYGSVTVINTGDQLNEQFLGSGFPPMGWSTGASMSGSAWLRANAIQTDGSTGGAGKLDFYNRDSLALDTLKTPVLDLSTLAAVPTDKFLTFYHAYRSYSASYSDSVKIIISSDGGATWPTVLYNDGYPTMATSPTTTQSTAYTPASGSEWRRNTVQVPAGMLTSSFRLAVVGKSAFGNNFWIDNIRIKVLPDTDYVVLTLAQVNGIPTPFRPGSVNDYVSKKFVTETVEPRVGTPRTEVNNSRTLPSQQREQEGNLSAVLGDQNFLDGNPSVIDGLSALQPITLKAAVQNVGKTALAYQASWTFGGVSQTPVSRPSLGVLAVDSVTLSTTPSQRGTFTTTTTVTIANDNDPSDNSKTTYRTYVYPDPMYRLKNDNGTNLPNTFIGFSTSLADLEAGVRFTASQAMRLGNVDAYYRNETSTDSVTVKVYAAGANDSTPGALLYSKKFAGENYNSPGTGGDYFTLPLGTDAPVFASGTDFWVSIFFPPGISFPMGCHNSPLTTAGHSFISADSGATWSRLIVSSSERAWLLRVVGTDTASSANINVALNTGWNMISNPVTNPIPGDSVKQLYPTSLNQYAFEFVAGSGYQQRFKMANGKGYWGKFPSATSNPISGSPRTQDSLSVVTGWNMVGTISVAVDTSTIVSVPAGIRGSNWFGYSAGYSAVTQLVPGKGYWVKATGAGKFVLNGVSLGAPNKVQAMGDGIERLNTLTITDSRGGSQTLYFGVDAQKTVPVAMYAMPPVPPTGAFDARFESTDGGSMVQTYAEEGNSEYGVSVQSDAYPLTVSWKTMDGVYELHDGIGGVKELRGEGSMRIADVRATRLLLKLVAGTEVPSEYALLQNYPNPFNPTTNIKFALPVVSRVDVEVYNVLGQRVTTLVNDNLAAGYHVVEWNGTGNTGLQLGSGVYFLRLAATGTDGRTFAEVRKLMMVK